MIGEQGNRDIRQWLKKEDDGCRLKKNGLEISLKQMKWVLSKKVTDEKETDEECVKACHAKKTN